VRILIIRTSALGDVVHALPVLTALRRELPEARIGWVVEEAMAPLLAGHPDLDVLIVARLRAWRRRPLARRTLREVTALLTALGDFSPDVTLDLMGNHKAGILAALTLADRRIGARQSFRREPSSALWISEGATPRGTHAVERALSLLSPLGIREAPPDFGAGKLFPEPPVEEKEFLDTLPGPFVLVQPGAGWGNKRYPAAWWGEAAARLQELTGLAAIVAAAPGEEDLAQTAAAASRGAARARLLPTLAHLAAILRRARLVLGGDTGPVHLAHALGTPVLCVMGPTDPERHGPWAAPERAVWKRLPCSFCHRRFAETKACLREIPPTVVAERAAHLLEATTQLPPVAAR
jgi:heptosyltransferase-1